MNGPDRTPFRQMLQRALLASPAKNGLAGDPNRVLLASMIAGQAAGFGCLPAHLGLGGETFGQLTARYFPNETVTACERRLDDIPEHEDLLQLLTDERIHQHDSEVWVARIVATACAGSDHLWQDLGLANRDELSKLMWINFPSLARANSGDMKWKKFLYRQICAREGIYVCPAPSCGVCTDFAKCFGPEN